MVIAMSFSSKAAPTQTSFQIMAPVRNKNIETN